MSRYYALLFLVFFLTSCANLLPLSGGIDDEIAPKPLLETAQPKHTQTNVSPTKFSVEFDEFFSLKDPQNTVSINPSLGKLIVEQNKKEVIIRWEKQPELNTSYLIQMNGTIQDVHEKNDSIYQFVFSTGNFIDSLSLKGKVKDDFTNMTLKNASVALFSEESTVFGISPMYVTRSNDEGKFEFNYLKEGNFQLITWKDENKNQLVDSAEGIGFLKENILLPSTKPETIYLGTKKNNNSKLQATILKPGAIVLSGKKLDLENVTINNEQATLLTFFKADSATFSLPSSINGRFEIISGKDTLSKTLTAIERKKNFSLISSTKKCLVGDSVFLHSNEQITSFTTSQIQLLNEENSPVEFKSLLIKNEIVIIPSSYSAKKFNLKINKDAILGNENFCDSSVIEIPIYQEKDLSELVLDLKEFSGNYIVQLINENKVFASKIKENEQTVISFQRLIPNNYSVILIKDENRNGVWDSNNFTEKKQAEKIYRFTLSQKMRASWTIEETLKLPLDEN